MIKVLFFARIREELECRQLELPWGKELVDLDALSAYLCREKGEHWQTVLGQQNIIRAVNQQVIAGNTALADGDEVAFFPPVTGG